MKKKLEENEDEENKKLEDNEDEENKKLESKNLKKKRIKNQILKIL